MDDKEIMKHGYQYYKNINRVNRKRETIIHNHNSLILPFVAIRIFSSDFIYYLCFIIL